eukprot:8512079-Karenia_brevis.AAC.1
MQSRQDKQENIKNSVKGPKPIFLSMEILRISTSTATAAAADAAAADCCAGMPSPMAGKNHRCVLS